MFTADFSQGEALAARLEEIPVEVQAALASVLRMRAEELVEYVKSGKLSGQVLKAKTGNLRASIHSRVEASGAAVWAYVYSSGVPYAAIHEYGGKTPAHVIVPKTARMLVFEVAGKTVFAKRVNHPGSRMPERSFLRSAYHDRAAQIGFDMKMAVIQAIQRKVNG